MMTITRTDVAEKLRDYLQHRLSLHELVHWAEIAMMDADFDVRHSEKLRDVVSRLGLADVRNFGLTWEDCQEFLEALGYHANIEIYPTEPVLRLGDDSAGYEKKGG